VIAFGQESKQESMNIISRPWIVALVAAGVALFSGCATTCSTCKNSVFVVQPEDATVPVGSEATFTAVAVEQPPYSPGGLSYQWQQNHSPYISIDSTNWVDRPGATMPTLTIPSAGTNDVGFYRLKLGASLKCLSKAVPLSVYSLTNGGGSTITVYGPGVLTSANPAGDCPGPYVASVSYKKSALGGWGWAPIPGATPYVAADGSGRTDTKVEMLGSSGDRHCSLTPCTVTTPLPDAKYRFTIYFPSSPPTTSSYPLVLTNFNP
jgi:hypothetical protein